MESETIIYGVELLVMLDGRGRVSIPEFEKESKIKGSELKELLKYLDKKEYLKYRLGLFVNESKISDSTIELLPKGMEVVLDKRDYFSEMNKSVQTIHNQTNVSNSSEFQVAQTTGDNSLITQIQDNSKMSVLRQLIEDDKELEEPKKKKLFEILDKFNMLKKSGENAYELIKQVGLIAARYIPLFFELLH